MPEITFTAPGPGPWELEQTHFSKPATRYLGEIFPEPLARGFGEGTKRYGLMLDTLRMAVVNDFCYAKFCPVGAPDSASGPPPRAIFTLLTWLHPEIRRRINAGPDVFARKLWREDMKRWDEQYKPDSIARNSKLQNTAVASLGDAEFLVYLEDIRDNVVEMIYRHHIFTIPSSFPVGHFLAEVQRWTGLPSGEVLGVSRAPRRYHAAWRPSLVLPLLGAIVTDRGWQLSHAAIVAREYGIPAVVGTRVVTTTFSDGARVRVNGDKGVVDLVEVAR